jgi:hypothetical protein
MRPGAVQTPQSRQIDSLADSVGQCVACSSTASPTVPTSARPHLVAPAARVGSTSAVPRALPRAKIRESDQGGDDTGMSRCCRAGKAAMSQ